MRLARRAQICLVRTSSEAACCRSACFQLDHAHSRFLVAKVARQHNNRVVCSRQFLWPSGLPTSSRSRKCACCLTHNLGEGGLASRIFRVQSHQSPLNLGSSGLRVSPHFNGLASSESLSHKHARHPKQEYERLRWTQLQQSDKTTLLQLCPLCDGTAHTHASTDGQRHSWPRGSTPSIDRGIS